MQAKKFKSAFPAVLALAIGLTLFPMPVSGQLANHLILKKNGYHTKMNFLTGDPITFIREGNNFAEGSYIDGIGIDFIVVSGQVIPISKITAVIRTRPGFNFRASGKALMLAAPGYLVIGAINELFHQRGNKFQASGLVPSRGNLIVAGSLLTAGLILPVFQVGRYPIGKKFTLMIAQIDPALNR